MPTPGEIEVFKWAMRAVYGPFDTLTEVEAQMWIPPINPGVRVPKGRHLWTDAFGVINFITLAKETVSPVYLVLAKRLVHAVHNVLGKTPDGSARLYPATDEEPLKGGLRIGQLESNGPDDDGQYHLWVFALNRLALATGEIGYNRLAVQLAKAIFSAFIKWDKTTYAGGLRLAWKVSVDRERILVPEEGHYDAATGYVVLRIVQQAAEYIDGAWGILSREIASYHLIMNRLGRVTVSYGPLDFGMGLWMLQFFRDEDWARALANECLVLAYGALNAFPGIDLNHRVAFREFSTCLGLQCFHAGLDMTTQLQAIMRLWTPGQLEVGVPDGLKPMTLVMHAAAIVPGAFRDGYIWRWKR